MPDLNFQTFQYNVTSNTGHVVNTSIRRKTRLDALDEAAFEQAVKSLLSWTQHALIDRHAPARIIVPSGMERHIDYGLADDGTPQPPVLAVKLQELFGLPDTPRIAKTVSLSPYTYSLAGAHCK